MAPSRNRGVKKPKLRDLSHTPLTPTEVMDLVALLNEQKHPITTAIIGAVNVEHALDRALRHRLKRNDDDTWESLVSDRGPLGTFSAKIAMGFAMSMYNEGFRDTLHTVRVIRNAFAHSRKLIDFDHELILKELRGIKTFKKSLRFFNNATSKAEGARLVYASLSLQLSTRLTVNYVKLLKSSVRYRERKMSSPFANALAASLPVVGLGALGQGHLKVDTPSAGSDRSNQLGGLLGLWRPSHPHDKGNK